VAEGRPVAYLIDILPQDVLDLTHLRQTTLEESRFTGSILDLLLRQGNPALQYTAGRLILHGI
jgi:hypothetical protein